MAQCTDTTALIGSYLPISQYPEFAAGAGLPTERVQQAFLSRLNEEGSGIPFPQEVQQRTSQLAQRGAWERIELAPFKGTFPPASECLTWYPSASAIHTLDSIGITSFRLSNREVILDHCTEGGPFQEWFVWAEDEKGTTLAGIGNQLLLYPKKASYDLPSNWKGWIDHAHTYPTKKVALHHTQNVVCLGIGHTLEFFPLGQPNQVTSITVPTTIGEIVSLRSDGKQLFITGNQGVASYDFKQEAITTHLQTTNTLVAAHLIGDYWVAVETCPAGVFLSGSSRLVVRNLEGRELSKRAVQGSTPYWIKRLEVTKWRGVDHLILLGNEDCEVYQVNGSQLTACFSHHPRPEEVRLGGIRIPRFGWAGFERVPFLITSSCGDLRCWTPDGGLTLLRKADRETPIFDFAAVSGLVPVILVAETRKRGQVDQSLELYIPAKEEKEVERLTPTVPAKPSLSSWLRPLPILSRPT